MPEVLLKVVEAKRLLETGKVASVHEATERLGVSRSSFYKYKDDIFPFHDNSQGTTITLTLQMNDEPGLLSDVLKVIADFKANILTIHQSIPINGIASLSISVQDAGTFGTTRRRPLCESFGKGVKKLQFRPDGKGIGCVGQGGQ